jgi:hypothetical protein
MFNRVTPLVIHGRAINDPLAVKLAEDMTEERALFIAELRITRQYTWRMISEECSRSWKKEWGSSQVVGEALCTLASAYFGEDWDYLDTQSN